MLKIGDSTVSKLYIGDTNIQKAYLGDVLVFGEETPPTPVDYSKEYFTLKIKSNGNIGIKAHIDTYPITLDYRINNGTWNSYLTSSNPPYINVNSGDTVQFKAPSGVTYTGTATDTSGYNTFSGSSSTFDVYGNVMSLLDGENYSGATTLSGQYNFIKLFQDTGVVDASNLVLPATTLTPYCYRYMFQGCSSLTTAPELPATTLSGYCYQQMFEDCASLTQVPSILPATTLEVDCYRDMFRNCTSLVTAPEISATKLGNNCCRSMFQGCTNLVSSPSILSATALTSYCYYNMFFGCTSLTTAPELPATSLVSYCYSQMFSGCTNLNYIKCLARYRAAANNTKDWVSGVAATGTFVKSPNATTFWTTDANGIPENWTVIDAT